MATSNDLKATRLIQCPCCGKDISFRMPLTKERIFRDLCPHCYRGYTVQPSTTPPTGSALSLVTDQLTVRAI